MHIIINQLEVESTTLRSCPCYGHYYPNLLASLGYSGINPPVAALLKSYQGLEGEWIIASPVHFAATHNGVFLNAASDSLELSEQDAHQLFTQLSSELAQNGLKAIYYDSQTWLICVDNVPPLQSRSVYAMLNQSIMPVLNTWDSSLFWQTILTTLQLSLAQANSISPNERAFKVNGLWFWGEGKEVRLTDKVIWSDDDVLLSQGAKPLELDRKWQKNDILAIKKPSDIDLPYLKQRVAAHSVTWHWNNMAYFQPKPSFWSRLWSK